MSLIVTDSQNYTDIASAIRTKLSTASTFKPSEMASAILDITGTATGTVNITSNGTFNVASYASASVAVPDPAYTAR